MNVSLKRKTSRSRITRWMWRNPFFVLLTVIVATSVLAPLILPDPLTIYPGANLSPPSNAHWFGTDQYGMDVFTRVISAARLDLGVGVVSAALAILIGMPLGAVAAYRGGWLDSVILRTSESFQAFPAMLLALGAVAALGPSIPNLVVVVTVVNVPVYVRLTRSAALPLKEAEFILAARVGGMRPARVLRKHVLPNVAEVVRAQLPVNVAWAIQMLAALSFLGLGVRIPTPEWGAMIRAGADHLIYGNWWISVFPGIAVLVTILALNNITESDRS